jgi:Rho-binding antiterminator
MMSDYRPISCANHEQLEFAALRKQWLNVAVKGGEQAGVQRVLPLDVYARDGVEWLEAESKSGEKLNSGLMKSSSDSKKTLS